MPKTITARQLAGTNPDRMAQDQELYAQLQVDGFKGPRFQKLTDDLWLYGWKVMRRWMKDGTIVERCGENKIYIPARYTEVETMMRMADLREELAVECVAPAVKHFTERILPGGHWDPEKGAAMRTYFLRSCIYFFRDVFKRWSSRHRRRLVLHSETSLLYVDRPSTAPRAEEQMVLRETARRILQGASWEAKAICSLIYEAGIPHTEIGQQLGMTSRSVEGHMRRLRAHAWRLERADQANEHAEELAAVEQFLGGTR